MTIRYDYEELRAAAVADRTPESIAALAEWMEQYGSQFWNGECYDIDNGLELWPIYGEMDEDESCPIIGYEIR